ncbi:hypothetical protein [Neptuniibacter sp.]|uniref:hypothetical protein n=1 Tax=Neptuniibacter sp. TaxID=1962643 RepID=UPI003B5A56A6
MNKVSFWLIWSVGLVPLLVAMAMYFFGILLPQDKKHGGELLSGQHIEQWQLQRQHQPSQLGWQLLLTAPDHCRKNCDQLWGVLSNLHTALGKDRDRVQLYRISKQPEDLKSSKLPELGAAVWIVDPLGNVVIRYSLDEPPKQMLRDLRKLLKVSRIG